MTNTYSGSRGVILTAAATLIATLIMVGFFLAGIGSDEVSRADYRSSLITKLSDDERLVIPSQFTDDMREEYVSCLAESTYPAITDDARRIVVGDDPLQELHEADFETIILQAGDCQSRVGEVS